MGVDEEACFILLRSVVPLDTLELAFSWTQGQCFAIPHIGKNQEAFVFLCLA